MNRIFRHNLCRYIIFYIFNAPTREIKGQIQIGDDFARLENVNANLLAIAGQEDPLATPGAAKRVMDHVSSTDKTFRVAPGGHMGILAGSKAPRASWLELADWLAARPD